MAIKPVPPASMCAGGGLRSGLWHQDRRMWPLLQLVDTQVWPAPGMGRWSLTGPGRLSGARRCALGDRLWISLGQLDAYPS